MSSSNISSNSSSSVVVVVVMLLVIQEVRRVMDKMLTDLQLPMDIAEECLLQREKRTDIDQVHDEVEKCISKVRTA